MRNANETPWMIGRRDPTVIWSDVAMPEQMNAELIRIAVWAASIPIAGPRRSGTRMVPPNMVRTCCSPRPNALMKGLGTSSRP